MENRLKIHHGPRNLDAFSINLQEMQSKLRDSCKELKVLAVGYLGNPGHWRAGGEKIKQKELKKLIGVVNSENVYCK